VEGAERRARSQACTRTEWLRDSIAAWITGDVNGVVRAVSPGKLALRLHAEVVPLVQFTGWYTSMKLSAMRPSRSVPATPLLYVRVHVMSMLFSDATVS
jgi:hypothetical protein